MRKSIHFGAEVINIEQIKIILINPLQCTGKFTSLYLIIKGETFPWFRPFYCFRPPFPSSVLLRPGVLVLYVCAMLWFRTTRVTFPSYPDPDLNWLVLFLPCWAFKYEIWDRSKLDRNRNRCQARTRATDLTRYQQRNTWWQGMMKAMSTSL
jgi:hypothetical protein